MVRKFAASDAERRLSNASKRVRKMRKIGLIDQDFGDWSDQQNDGVEAV